MKKIVKKAQIPKNVSVEWFDRLVKNSMMMPIIARRIARLERRIKKLNTKHTGKKHILVWRNTGGVGDILMQSVIARELKRVQPNSHIVYQVPENYLAIPKHNPCVDEVQVVETPFVEDGFDKTIKLSNPCPASVYESTREPHITKNRIDLFLEAAGMKAQDKSLNYQVKAEEKKWAEEFLRGRKALNKIKIGFELRSIEKRRDWTRWKELAELIHKNIKNSKVLIFDHDIKMAWKNKKIINVCGFPIEDVAAIMERLDLIIGPDSGLLHLAGALGTKILGLFGPTNPVMRLNTYNADWIWLNKKCDICPCWYSYPCGDTKCLKKITPGMVLKKIRKML